MSTFSVPVVRIDAIEEHPNADALEIAVIGGFRCITRIGDYKAGDIAVYIPEASIVPEWLMKRMGLWDMEKDRGRLVGKQYNRVKAIKLRGVVSQGLLYPVSWGDPETEMGETVGLPTIALSDAESYLLYDFHGDQEEIKSRCIDVNVADVLGITKYEPPIPSHMNGEVCNLFGHTLKFDIENIQKHPDVIAEGDEIVITEKLHGTWTCFGFDPDLKHDELYLGGTIITSKGLSEQGLAFKWNEANERNLYVQMFKKYMVDTGFWDFFKLKAMERGPIYLLGETFGKGVQDLDYGLSDKQFRLFGIYVGKPGQGNFVSDENMDGWIERILFSHVERVPVLYRGPFSHEIVEKYRDGKDTITGKHMREGVVITPTTEQTDIMLGRVVLKAVSPDYLLRKGNATEYN